MMFQTLELASHVPAVVREVARTRPNHPFLILDRSESKPFVLTFGALVERATRYAAEYRRREIQPGSSVVLMLVTHPDLAPAFLGSMMAGLVPTIFPPMSPKLDKTIFWSSQAAAFSRIDVKLLITNTQHAAEVHQYMPDLLASVLDVDAGLSDHPAGVLVDTPSDIAFLQHSSGTTGTKKGVVLKHRAVLDAVGSLAIALDARQEDIIASWLPLYHDMGLIACLIMPMVLGLTVYQIDPFEWVMRPQSLLTGIETQRATLCWMPNFGFHHLMRAVPDPSAYDLSSMRAFIDCSEPCKAETLRSFAVYSAKANLPASVMQVCYALAENVFAATHTALSKPPTIVSADFEAFTNDGVVRPVSADRPSIDFVSAGVPVVGTEVRILDAHGVRLGDSHVGEIGISAPYLFESYYGMGAASSVFVDGFYRTGDQGFMSRGELYVCGRIDDLLIVNGRNVYAHDVEYAINNNTAVRPGRCVAISPFNKKAGSQVLVLIAEATEAHADARKALASEMRLVTQSIFGLTAFDVRIVETGWLVKTTSGKISRKANALKYERSLVA